MDLRLLGPVEAVVGGEVIELGPPKQRAVLAMLGLDLGRSVSADRLAEGLWGEQPPSSAAKMVQLYVSRLRGLLDGTGASIVTHGRGYELRLSDGDVDVRRAERLLEQKRAREALDLWRGPPLADVSDEPFAAAEIRRLEELRLRATELAIDADIVAGRHGQVVGELDALVAEYPLRERLHGLRMLALYRCGRQADALQAYRDARAGLVEQIGVEPGADLRRLHEAILAQDPALDPPAPAKRSTGRRPPPRAPSRRWLLIPAAVLLVGGLLGFGLDRVLEPDGLPRIADNAIGLIEPDSGRITAQHAVGRLPSAVTQGGGSVWVANAGDGTVSRIDRGRGGRVMIPVGGAPSALAYGGDALWVADSDARTIALVDPGQNKVLDRLDVGNAPRALAVAAGVVWVASGVDGRVKGVDLDRGQVTRSVAVGANPSALVTGAGALWVASEEAGTVTRLDPRTGAVVRAIAVGNGPSALASGEGAVWVLNRLDGTLYRIDPRTNTVSWAVRVGRDPTAVAVGAGSVWVAGGEQGIVTRVDPEQPQTPEIITTEGNTTAITVVGDSVWAAAGVSPAEHRGGTLRVLLPAPIPVDPLHPVAYGSLFTAQLSSLVYDGLVAYRRVEGASGATLVGALATHVPAPGADGRTYVFTLRRGLRFSDGRAVRPVDFRASMERLFDATRDRPEGGEFPPLYAGIVGARRCMRAGPCDLRRGIRVDPRAHTITVRLRRPDAEFLHKLSMVWAAVVPAGSSAVATDGVPAPGTGPYRVATWDLDRGGALVRNPRFRADPSRSRPSGFADRIDARIPKGSIEAQIRAVQRGRADLAVIADPFGSRISEDRLRALVAQAPGRVHSDPAATTDYLSLNVRRPPFDDIRVRRAVNLALDRSRIVALSGGPEVGHPTCQIVPVAFPGHEPYCRYTAAPAVGKGWTGTDVAGARRLVAASGRAGERVVVWMPPFRRPVGRYVVGVLRRLGLDATLRVMTETDFAAVFGPRTKVQAAGLGWAADYLEASTFIEPLFACPRPGQFLNASRLCDPTLERLIDRAKAATPADAASAWAAADRRVMDLAAAAPMTNRRVAVLVSRRAGNVQHHAQWFTLLDQLWVR